MDMDPYAAAADEQFQQPSNSNPNSGLLRFRSAPTSLFSSFNTQQPPSPPNHLPNFTVVDHSDSTPASASMDDKQQQLQLGGAAREHLITRQTSSPAGIFSNLTSINAYGMMGGTGTFRLPTSSAAASGEDHSNRLKPQIPPAPGLSSTSIGGHLPRIPEIGAETTNESGSDDGEGAHTYATHGYSFTSWNDSPSALKTHQQEDNRILYSGLETSASQNAMLPHRTRILSHHLSLPKTSAEMAAVEKLLNFQETVPCKIRAKRGYATHPRSIAERVRRTRISERMKQLQELVPNMEKQVNTSEMLDLAVDYIKDLQKQYKILSDNRARCKCLPVQQ